MRTLKHLSAALTALLLTMAMVLLTAGPVSATSGYPPEIGGDTSTGGTGGTGTNPGGGTGGSGDANPGGDGRVYDSIRLTRTNWDFNLGEYTGLRMNGSCPPKPLSGGDSWFATSVSFWYDVDPDGTPIGGFSYRCSYPPKPVDTPVTCSSRIVGSITNPKGPSSVRTIANRTVRSAWANDRDNPAKCANSLSLSVTALMDDLGAYLVSLRGTTVPCTKRTYPGTNRGDAIVSCGVPVTRTKTVQAGMWCDETVRWAFGPGSWHHAWEWIGCAGGEESLVKCRTSDDVPTFDGITPRRLGQTFAILDDAKRHSLAWPKFKPAGVVAISDVKTRFALKKGSSPYRNGVPVNDPTQPFDSDRGFSAIAGDVSKLQVAWMAPGTPGHPFGIYRISGFDATVIVKIVKITTVDFTTMQVHTNTVTRTVKATDLGCSSPAGYVDVYRARNATH